MMQTEPTDKDVTTLARAFDLERRFDAGIFPRDGAQAAHFRKLCRFGVLEFKGTGRDIDGERDSDVSIYRLTDLGRSWIEAREGVD